MGRNIKAVLIDLSGTLYVGQTPIPSCVEALRRLRTANIPFRICSNNSKESTRSLLSKLGGMGFQIQENELFTSLSACREVVRKMNVKRPYLLLSDSALEEFSCLSDIDARDASEFDAVVVGLAPERLTYHHLNTAFRILVREHHTSTVPRSEITVPVPLIAMHKSRYLQEKDGLSLGPGGFVTALEYALGNRQRAEVVGKPERTFFRLALESLKADGIDESYWSQIAVVGDDVEADLGGGAIELGLWRVLVKTGKYREGDESKGASPDEIYASFPAFVDTLL